MCLLRHTQPRPRPTIPQFPAVHLCGLQVHNRRTSCPQRQRQPQGSQTISCSAALHRAAPCSDPCRKNLKKAESQMPRSPAKHWTSGLWRPSEKKFPENLKVPQPTARWSNVPGPWTSQNQPIPNGIEQNRTRPNAKSHDLPRIAGNARRPDENSPRSERATPTPAGVAARPSPDPPRSPRRPPTLRSPLNSSPAARPARSGCPPRSTARPGQSARP